MTDERKPGLGVFQVILSVAAAMLGVQSESNRQRDFTHGNPIVFVGAGVVATALLVMAIWLAVQVLLTQAGV